MKTRLLLTFLFCAFVCTATPTTITDTLLQPYNGLPAAGVDISVTQAAFFSGSTYYPAWTLTPHPATDANGLFSFALEPNPAGQLYVVTMKQTNGVTTSSCWNVPASGSPVNVQTVLSTTCGTPPLSIVQLGQLAQGGASLNNLMGWNGSSWAALAGGVARVSTQFNKSDNALANIPGLTLPVLAGHTYTFRAVLYVTITSGNGHAYAISGTATASNIIYDITSVDEINSAFGITSRQTALGGSAGSGGLGSSFFLTTITGTITVNAGGTLTVQFAELNSGSTSSVLIGSYMTMQDML